MEAEQVQEADVVRVDDLCLGATSPKKVVHHRGCPHARTDYIWAREQGSIKALAWELYDSGALHWHHFCQTCCGDVEDFIRHALMAGREESAND